MVYRTDKKLLITLFAAVSLYFRIPYSLWYLSPAASLIEMLTDYEFSYVRGIGFATQASAVLIVAESRYIIPALISLFFWCTCDISLKIQTPGTPCSLPVSVMDNLIRSFLTALLLTVLFNGVRIAVSLLILEVRVQPWSTRTVFTVDFWAVLGLLSFYLTLHRCVRFIQKTFSDRFSACWYCFRFPGCSPEEGSQSSEFLQ